MSRWFNTAGPCNPQDHYMLKATDRLPDVARLIEQKGYFVIHAPRQTGKTTAMLTLAQELTASGKYVAALVSMEVGAAFNDDPDAAEEAILSSWRTRVQVRLPQELQPPAWPQAKAGNRIGAALQAWAQAAPLPLVLFLDEIDALEDMALLSVLRQLRDGYYDRPQGFPWSLALIGLRDVRDYKVASGGSQRLHSASPFNIKVRSLTLANFTHQEVQNLYEQHTSETGQAFTKEAIQLAFYLTQGQPWLVNALAKIAVEELVPDTGDISSPITVADIQQAKKIMIERQETHLDSLAERLREPRVRHIIEPMLAGTSLGNLPPDDIRFVLDLGLCRMDKLGGLVVANPIYHEVLPTVLAGTPIASLPRLQPTWLNDKAELETSQLLEAFLTFWRRHGEALQKSAPYAEIAPHLVMMAFLDRVSNAGGTLEREYAIGSGRMDLCLRYGEETLAIELKAWRTRKRDPKKDGLRQLDNYLSGLELDTGWLVIFDQRHNQPPVAERTTTEEATTPLGRTVTLIRA